MLLGATFMSMREVGFETVSKLTNSIKKWLIYCAASATARVRSQPGRNSRSQFAIGRSWRR